MELLQRLELVGDALPRRRHRRRVGLRRPRGQRRRRQDRDLPGRLCDACRLLRHVRDVIFRDAAVGEARDSNLPVAVLPLLHVDHQRNHHFKVSML